MPTLKMLVGLPGSGKSTVAKNYLDENTVYLSSDELREELLGNINNQEGNVDVFEEMSKRAKDALSQGKDVLYDATNINRKRRMHTINNVIKADKKIAIYVFSSYEECLLRNAERDRVVPEEVISKMYKNLHIPTTGEGFDEVIFESTSDTSTIEFGHMDSFIEGNHETVMKKMSLRFPKYIDIYDLPQDSSYHSFSVSRHTYHVYDYVRKNYKGERLQEMLFSALFHDLGKAFCKSFKNFKGEKTKYANFIGHECVSSQLVVSELSRFNYNEDKIKYIADLVQFHMMPMNASNKTKKKLEKLLAEEQLEDLYFLHEADLQAK